MSVDDFPKHPMTCGRCGERLNTAFCPTCLGTDQPQAREEHGIVADLRERLAAAERENERLRGELTTYRDVAYELQRAVRKFPTWPTDPLHALAVLGEEFGELTKAVVQHTYEPQKSTLHDVKSEAIQTTAMAVRFLISLDVYQYAGCEQHKQEAARAAGGDT